MTINADTLKVKLKAIQQENKLLSQQSNDLSRQQAEIVEQLKANCGKLQMLEELLRELEASDDENG